MNFVKNSINFTAGGKSVKIENDAIAPNGVKEATRFFSPASVKSTTFDTPLNPITFVTDKIYCRSIFVKPVSDNPEPRLLPFIIGGENTQHRLGIFNLKTKIFTWQYAQAGEVGTIFQANYKEYDNGWIRVWWNIKKTLTNTLGLNSYHMGGYGDGNNGSMWVWGAQVEEVATLNSEPGEYEQTGGDSLIFYNRDSNVIVTNPISSLIYKPTYGSKVFFSSNVNKYDTHDNYINMIPLSINSLIAKFDLKFDLNELEAQQLVNFIENKKGVYDFSFKDPSNIYRSIDGFCTQYAINFINKNHYEVALSLDVDQASSILNWYNSCFVNYDEKYWRKNVNYNKYDILYSESRSNESNLLRYSENFSERKYWASANINLIHTRLVLNPFGQDSCYRINAALNGWHGFYPGKGLGAGFNYSNFFERTSKFSEKMTFSIFVRADAASPKYKFMIGLEFMKTATTDETINPKSYHYCSFNLQNQTMSRQGEGVVGQITPYANGWFRCSITVLIKNDHYVPVFVLLDNAPDYSGNWDYNIPPNDGFMYIWGAQVQNGDLLDYVKTEGSPKRQNRLNSFYYCGYNHNSKEGIDTEPGDSISPWRQDFFFEPDLAMQNSVDLKVEKINFKNSFSQRIKTKKNIATTDFTYKFSNITTQKARAILHFLENKGGYRRFRVNMDSVYNKPKVFYSPSWTHTWKYENSHDIEVQLIEDPLGIIPKNS